MFRKKFFVLSVVTALVVTSLPTADVSAKTSTPKVNKKMIVTVGSKKENQSNW